MQTPLIHALEAYARAQRRSFHTPGHKDGAVFTQNLTALPLDWDTTELPGTDHLHAPEGSIAQAQALAAQAFHAWHTFFLVNGATAGIQAMLLSALKPGDALLVPRDCHHSVYHACVLGDLIPYYMEPQPLSDGLYGSPSAASIERALTDNPGMRAILITRPGYYGLCCDLEPIAQLARQHGIPLLVDEAHGSHLVFSDLLPSSAAHYATAWVHGAHKTLPALTQGGLLHTNDPSLVAPMQRVLAMLETSSPSYPIMASLDGARAWMQSYGTAQLERVVNAACCLRERLERSGLCCLTAPDSSTMLDLTRLTVDVSNMGITGWQARDWLSQQAHIDVELADYRRVVCILTVADSNASIAALGDAFIELAHAHAAADTSPIISPPPMPMSAQTDMPPRQAFFAEARNIALKDATGYIASAPIGAYPPGIPLFLPGQRITREGVEWLVQVQAMGCGLFGVSEDGAVGVVSS